MKPISFKSSLFSVYPFEDDNLNPGILGKSLAEWVQGVLNESKYPISEFIEEDFGYCLMVHRKPYWLWVGCCGHSTHDFPENGLSAEIADSFPLDTIEWNFIIFNLAACNKLSQTRCGSLSAYGYRTKENKNMSM